MTAISDSSPLILLATIGRLDLLHSVFREIVIPPAVRREVTIAGAGRPGAAGAAAAGWISVRAPTNLPAGARQFGPIGAGETEVVALALKLGRGLPVLLDDRAGRRVAEHQNLLVIGSGGVLIRAQESI
jgi:predicted nucleic acid-binding protein